jgi:hypothetical protein
MNLSAAQKSGCLARPASGYRAATTLRPHLHQLGAEITAVEGDGGDGPV